MSNHDTFRSVRTLARIEGEMVAIYTLLLPKKEDGQSDQVMQERKEEKKEETKIRKEGIPCRVYEIKNEVENSEFKFKAIVFHCATREEFQSLS